MYVIPFQKNSLDRIVSIRESWSPEPIGVRTVSSLLIHFSSCRSTFPLLVVGRASRNSTVPRSLLIGQENVTLDTGTTSSQGAAEPTGGNSIPANNDGGGKKGDKNNDKGNDNGKKKGQDNKGKGNNNGKGNEKGQENKGKGNNNGKGGKNK